jgi:hypothetical protein
LSCRAPQRSRLCYQQDTTTVQSTPGLIPQHFRFLKNRCPSGSAVFSCLDGRCESELALRIGCC